MICGVQRTGASRRAEISVRCPISQSAGGTAAPVLETEHNSFRGEKGQSNASRTLSQTKQSLAEGPGLANRRRNTDVPPHKKLMYMVNVGSPDPRFGNMLLEQFGGANGELAAAMQYSI
jgi:hypothetical protein